MWAHAGEVAAPAVASVHDHGPQDDDEGHVQPGGDPLGPRDRFVLVREEARLESEERGQRQEEDGDGDGQREGASYEPIRSVDQIVVIGEDIELLMQSGGASPAATASSKA